MRVALDSNFLAYYSGVRRIDADQVKVEAAQRLLPVLNARCEIIIPAQVIGELYNVLTLRRGWSRPQVTARLDELRALYPIAVTSEALLFEAVTLATDHQMQIWNAIILASAAAANCELILSEDMHAGFIWRGCAIANPFAPNPRLAARLA